MLVFPADGVDAAEVGGYNGRMRLCFAALWLLWVVAMPAVGQPGGAAVGAGPTVADGPDPEATEQEVAVDEMTSDGDIKRRLGDIFETTGRYSDLGVEVRAGIVFITGTTAQADFKDQATQIARRTQGVVAVVNDLAVTPPSLDELAAQEARSLWRGFARALPLIALGLILLVVSVVLAVAVARLLTYPIGRVTDSRLLRNVIRKLAAILVVLGGLILFLRVTGLTGVALTVVSGTGLAGLILGFAFRDIAENFLASILLSVQTPFRLGDVIEVKGHTGVVHKVSARGTVLIDLDGNHIQIANADVYKATLKNFTANPKMQLHFVLGIGYDAEIERAQQVILDIVQRHSAVLDDPDPAVLVDNLGPSTVNLKVYFWIDGTRHSVLKVKSSVMRQVLAAAQAADISLPDTAREIIFPQGVPIDQEGGDGERPAPRPPAANVSLTEVTAAEGDLHTEVPVIKHQAAHSRDPEEGPDIIAR